MDAPTSQTCCSEIALQSGRCWRPDGRRAKTRTVLAFTAVGALAGILSLLPSRPALVWNATPSAPLGLYLIEPRQLAPGDLLAVEPAAALRKILADAGALQRGRLLLKPLAAAQGDMVCRDGGVIAINGKISALARAQTSDGRLLPQWSGCRRLAQDDVFFLSSHPDSFDSRYFGPIKTQSVLGVARPIATFVSDGASR